jgi:hypothetical protein
MTKELPSKLDQEIFSQLPDHIEPGSLLAEMTGLDKNPKVYQWFYDHLNSKHWNHNQPDQE